MRPRFGLLGILAFVALALLIGGIGYSLGAATAQTAVVATGTAGPGTVVVPAYLHGWGWGWGFVFPLFGIFFLILLIALLFRAFRPRSWNGGGWGGHGGPWSPDDVPPAFRSRLETWHRQAHEQPNGNRTDTSGRTGTA